MAGKYFLYSYRVGEIVQMKKKHPCGSDRWEVLRVGADIKISCRGCGHLLSIPRAKIEKMTKSTVLPQDQEQEKNGH